MVPALTHCFGTPCSNGTGLAGGKLGLSSARHAAAPAGPGGLLSASAARRLRPSCRAASGGVPPPAPPPPLLVREREPRSSGRVLPAADMPGIGNYPICPSWLSYSWRLSGMPQLEDAVRERLRRQLGAGGRWAWQHEEHGSGSSGTEEERAAYGDVESDVSEDEDEMAEAEDGAAASGNLGSAAEQPLVRSARGARQRRAGSRRHCRGRVLAGAVEYEGRAAWMHNPLPAELQSCTPDQLLTASQEAQLAELIQDAKLAAAAAQAQLRQQQQVRRQHVSGLQQQVASVAMPASAVPLAAAGPVGSHLRQTLQTGAAAWQLLFDCNWRLVSAMRRKLVYGQSLPASLHQELFLAGLDALGRAAGHYLPAVHGTRFSTYAGAAIRNAMCNVLAEQQLVQVPASTRDWARRVQRAACSLQSMERQQGVQQAAHLASSASEPAAQPVRERGSQQRRQQQRQQLLPSRLESLAAAANVTPRQALLGLAAARRQLVVGRSCRVSVESVGGACASNLRQMAPFHDVEEAEACTGEEEAQHAVEQLLACLPPSKRRDLYLRVLLRRHGLSGAGRCSEGADELDFGSLGKELGLSRQGAQKLYHAAVAQARLGAAAHGLL